MASKDDAREAQQKSAAEEARETQQTEGHADDTRADLDFESLDLSVEIVEERISPSETNVFDK